MCLSMASPIDAENSLFESRDIQLRGRALKFQGKDYIHSIQDSEPRVKYQIYRSTWQAPRSSREQPTVPLRHIQPLVQRHPPKRFS